MANASYLKTLIRGAFSAPQQVALGNVFDNLLGNIRFGRCDDSSRAENIQAYAFDGTTHATPGTEFSIRHGLGAVPYLVIPILPLEQGAQLVPLTVTRAPDSERLYLSSSVASAPVRVLVEV